MTNKAKWAWATLGLSLLILLPLAAYFYLSVPTDTEVPAPERPSPIAALIADDRCDLAYPQLMALDPSPHIEFQRAFCERALNQPRRAYDRLRALDVPALDDYRRFWLARSLEDLDQTPDAIAEYENLLTTSANPILRNPASLRLAALYRTADQPAKALALYEQQLVRTPIARASSTCSPPPAKSTTRCRRKSGVYNCWKTTPVPNTPAIACRTCPSNSTPAPRMLRPTPSTATGNSTKPSRAFAASSAHTAATSASLRRTSPSVGRT